MHRTFFLPPMLMLLASMTLLPLAATAQTAPGRGFSISAQSAELTGDGATVYSGDVEFESDGLRIRAERLALHRVGDDLYDLHAAGTPAAFDHSATEAQPAVSASAREVRYLSADQRLHLDGDVSLTRGQDRLTGETLVYEIDTRRIAVSGGDGGRVRMTVQPPQPQNDEP